MKWLFLLLLFSTGCRAQTGNKLIFPAPPDKAFSAPRDIVMYLYTVWPRTVKDGCIQAFDIVGRSIYIGSAKVFNPVSGFYIIFENEKLYKYVKL